MKKILLLIAFGCSQSLWAQTLSPLEQKIVDAVNNKMAYAEALLKESVDINSGSLRSGYPPTGRTIFTGISNRRIRQARSSR